jgi:hypothetical protein
MSQSATDVGNQALVHIGAAPPFMTDIATDTTKPGKLLNQSLLTARQSLLAMHPWNFAKRRAVVKALTITGAANNGSGLIRITTEEDHWFVTGDKVKIASVTGTTEANGDWTVTSVSTKTFDLQSSTFANTYVSGGRCGFYCAFEYTWGFKTPDDLLVVRLVDDDPQTDYEYAQGRIYTTETTHNVEYTADVTVYTEMSILCYASLSIYLAWLTAYPITDSTKIRDNCWVMFDRTLKRAKFVDSTENPMKIMQTETLIRSRKQGYQLADPKRYK